MKNLKITKSFSVDDYEVLTDDGFKDISFLHQTVPYRCWKLTTDQNTLICAAEHILINEFNEQQALIELKIGDKIKSVNGLETVLDIVDLNYDEEMFDITTSDIDGTYYTNDLLSHNTTIYCAYCLWYVCFNLDKSVLILANKGATAIEIMDRLRESFQLLPKWLKPGVVKWSRLSIHLANGSKIVVALSSSSSSRGKSGNILIFDEAAHIPRGVEKELWTSIFPVLSSSKDSQCIMVSTPNGASGLFYETYSLAEQNEESGKRKGWLPFVINWYDVPGRDEEWKEIQIEGMHNDMVKFNQEYGNCVTGDTKLEIQYPDGTITETTIKEVFDSFREDNYFEETDTILIRDVNGDDK